MDSREIQPRRVGNGRGADSGQIKAEIDETRGRIDETLDALGDKLHPRHLVDEVVDYLRNPRELKNAAGKVGQAILHQVREHPMPSLLIGAGLAWMLSEKTKGDDLESDDLESDLYASPDRSRFREATAAAGEAAGDLAHSVKDKTGELAQTVKEKTGEFAQNIKETSMTQAARLKEATGKLSSEGRARAGAAMHKAEAKFSQATEDYPLAMGLGVLAVGVLAGLGLPRTRLEDRTMGERADQVKDTVRHQGRQAVETAQRAATAALGAATDAAQDEGLTPQNLGEKVKHIASDAARAASETAQREGLSKESLAHQVQHVAAEAKHAAQQEIERGKNP